MWYHLLAGPLVWGVYFLVGYGLVEIVCAAERWGTRLLNHSVLSNLILGLTLAAFLAALYAGWKSFRSFQLRRANANPNRLDENTPSFMALSGMMLDGLFALIILITGLPALVLDPCG